MIALLIRGFTLPGAVTGLLFFFTPQWEKLASLQVGDEKIPFISQTIHLN